VRRTLITLLLCCPAIAGAAAPAAEGRWEGRIRIPARELPFVVDLAPGKAGGWVGSIIIPGLGIKGGPLSNIVIAGADVAFDIDTALGSPTTGPAGFTGRLAAATVIAGEMRQGGNVAGFSLTRIGPSEVELPPRSTPVDRALEAEWTGSFELGGYARHVTLVLVTQGDAGATAKFVVVGKATNDLPVDLVVQDGDSLRVQSLATQVAFEGRVSSGNAEIRGTIELGPSEVPLVLRRAAGRTS
jgi:hypothetical protein